jgi:hypothetical protein
MLYPFTVVIFEKSHQKCVENEMRIVAIFFRQNMFPKLSRQHIALEVAIILVPGTPLDQVLIAEKLT